MGFYLLYSYLPAIAGLFAVTFSVQISKCICIFLAGKFKFYEIAIWWVFVKLPVLASRNDLPLWMSFMPDNSRSAALWIWPFLIGPLWFDEFFWKIGPAFRPPVASPVEDGMVGLMLVLRSWNYRVCFIFMYQSIL